MSRKEINPIEFEVQHSRKQTLFGIDLFTLIRYAAAAVFFIIGLICRQNSLGRLLFMLLSFLASGYGVVVEAAEQLLNERKVDERLLVVVAAFFSFLVKLEADGAGLMLFYCLMRLGLDYVSKRSRDSIMKAVDPRGTKALLQGEEGEETVDVSSLKPGDTILLDPGEVAPVDCLVLEGFSTLDASAVTGDAEPVEVEEGDTVPAGAVNISSRLQLEVAAAYRSSTMDQMWRILSDESNDNTVLESLLGTYRRYFAPIAVALTAVLAVLFTLIGKSTLSSALHRALTVLVIANPTSIAAAIGMTYFVGLRGAAHRGVLFRGNGAAEKTAACRAVIFDQNGTVTSSDYHVDEIRSDRMKSEILLKAAAHAAANASTQLMRAVVASYGGPIDYSIIGNFVEYPDGVKVEINSIPVMIGSREFLLENEIVLKEDDALAPEPALHAALGGHYAGSLLLSGSLQAGCRETVDALDSLGCRDVILLSEDEADKTAQTAHECGIRKYYSQCLPMDKLARVQEICERNHDGSTVYVAAGEGENAALACADVGMYLGDLNSEIAEEAQAIALDGSVTKVAEAFRSAANIRKVLTQGLIGVLAVKALLLLFALIGFRSQLWFAGFLDGAAGIGAVLNAVRAFPVEK